MLADLQKNLFISENLKKLVTTTKAISSQTVINLIKKAKGLFKGAPVFIPKYDYTAHFSVENFNDNLKNIDFDLSVLFPAINDYKNIIAANTKLALFEELKLITRLKNYSNILDSIQYGAPAIVETFQSLALVNTNLTTATVDTVAGNVINNINAPTENTVNIGELNKNPLYTVLTSYKKVNIISGILSNMFNAKAEEFKLSTQTKDNTCSVMFSITLPDDVTTLTVDLGTSSPARLELFGITGNKIYDSVDYLFTKNYIYLDSGSLKGIYNVKITKTHPELVFENLREFIIGIKNITAHQTTTTRQSELISKPLYFSDIFGEKQVIESFVLMPKDFGAVSYYYTTETPNQGNQFESIISSSKWLQSVVWKKLEKDTVVNLTSNSSNNYSFSFDATNKSFYKTFKLGETASSLVYNIGLGFFKYVEDATPETKTVVITKTTTLVGNSFELSTADIPTTYSSDYTLLPLNANTGSSPINKIVAFNKEISYSISETATGYIVVLARHPLRESEQM